ncbi:MAG: hypothetical protein OQK09_03260 [Colwellia sp.]|nr:hypothetical protein [Colwellia sp.]MCW9080505.1 hypothetical protein [Colwellia sp.]
MNKTAKILLLALAAFFLFIGIKSAQHSTAYTELTDIQTTKGTILTLHCPPKGAAALSLTGSDATYNLSIKFRADYCDDDNSNVLLGREVTMEYVQVNDNFYQVYQLTENDRNILSPEEVEADQSSATFGLFLLAFLLVALVIYKSRSAAKK